METIIEIGNFIDKHTFIGTIVSDLSIAGIIGLTKMILNLYKDRKTYPYVKPTYWGLSKNFNITNVLEFLPDPNSTGYISSQYSRTELWKGKIVKVSFFGIYHKIVPIDVSAMLCVLVRKKFKEKHINFNRTM